MTKRRWPPILLAADGAHDGPKNRCRRLGAKLPAVASGWRRAVARVKRHVHGAALPVININKCSDACTRRAIACTSASSNRRLSSASDAEQSRANTMRGAAPCQRMRGWKGGRGALVCKARPAPASHARDGRRGAGLGRRSVARASKRRSTTSHGVRGAGQSAIAPPQHPQAEPCRRPPPPWPAPDARAIRLGPCRR